MKDTVIISVGATGNLFIDASNPGDWMMHCHLSGHFCSGMRTAMHMGVSGARLDVGRHLSVIPTGELSTNA